MATFTPAADLTYGAVYTATITTAATDQASPANPLPASYVWTFTSAAAVVTPLPPTPTVLSTAPADGATNVPVSQSVAANFSAAMNVATLNAVTFTLAGPGGALVAGAVTYNASTSAATFTPAAHLAYSTLYKATITTAATNSAGTHLAGNYVWSFITATPPPTVASTLPANGATGVLPGQVLSATFSEAMNCGHAVVTGNHVQCYRSRWGGCSRSSRLLRQRRDLYPRG